MPSAAVTETTVSDATETVAPVSMETTKSEKKTVTPERHEILTRAREVRRANALTRQRQLESLEDRLNDMMRLIESKHAAPVVSQPPPAPEPVRHVKEESESESVEESEDEEKPVVRRRRRPTRALKRRKKVLYLSSSDESDSESELLYRLYRQKRARTLLRDMMTSPEPQHTSPPQQQAAPSAPTPKSTAAAPPATTPKPTFKDFFMSQTPNSRPFM